MNFIKMQTLGNDYAIIDCLSYKKNDFLKLKSKVKLLSDYHYGIGARGIVFITSSDKADVKMIMYNPDGTESKMCSDGLRCVAVYLNKKVKKVKFEIETKAGIIPVLIDKDVIINMGKINITPKKIPVITDKNIFINEDIYVAGERFKTTCLSVGNPHAVSFVDNVDNINLKEIGPYFEMHYLFPERVNVNFVQIINEDAIKIKTWERGVGEVLSCGSGACASVGAAILNHKLDQNKTIEVASKGGVQKVKCLKNEEMILKGKANFIYKGKTYIK